MAELNGSIALVTGAGSGIGAALVAALNREGVKVVAVDRNADALSQFSGNDNVIAHVADVTSEEANVAMCDRAVAELGGLDLVFLNAGVLGRPRELHRDPYVAGDLDLDDFRAMMPVNLDAVVYGTIAAAKAMAAVGDRPGGRAIVATASTAGLVSWPATPFYSAAKHGVVGWVRAMAEALGRQNVTINAICPAGVATPLVGFSADDDFDANRLLSPAQVARAMVATAAGAETGQAFSVVAGRDDVRQSHPFNDVPGFP